MVRKEGKSAGDREGFSICAPPEFFFQPAASHNQIPPASDFHLSSAIKPIKTTKYKYDKFFCCTSTYKLHTKGGSFVTFWVLGLGGSSGSVLW
jgi:hypothetical protein